MQDDSHHRGYVIPTVQGVHPPVRAKFLQPAWRPLQPPMLHCCFWCCRQAGRLRLRRFRSCDVQLPRPMRQHRCVPRTLFLMQGYGGGRFTRCQRMHEGSSVPQCVLSTGFPLHSFSLQAQVAGDLAQSRLQHLHWSRRRKAWHIHGATGRLSQKNRAVFGGAPRGKTFLSSTVPPLRSARSEQRWCTQGSI